MDHSLEVYNDYINLRFHPLYSCMISLPPPFNIFGLVCGIIALILRSQRWNDLSLKVSYFIFILIPFSFVFIIMSLISLPLSPILLLRRLIIHIGSDNISHSRKRSPIYRGSLTILRLITWLIFSVPYLFLVLITNDIPVFFASAFSFIDNKYTFTKISVLDTRVIKYASKYHSFLHVSRK